MRKIIFTAKIKLKNGKVIYARNYGIKAFRIELQHIFVTNKLLGQSWLGLPILERKLIYEKNLYSKTWTNC